MALVPGEGAGKSRPAYVAPVITVMNEEDVLKTFQLTSAMTGWWTPSFPGTSF